MCRFAERLKLSGKRYESSEKTRYARCLHLREAIVESQFLAILGILWALETLGPTRTSNF